MISKKEERVTVPQFNRFSERQKAAIAYIFANFLSKGLNFITIPLFTAWLTTSEMGVTTTFASLQTILYAVSSLGIVSGSFSVAMMTFESKRDRYTSASLVLTTISSSVFAVIGILIAPFWEKCTTLPVILLLVMVLYFFMQPALDLWFAHKRYENKYKSVFVVSFVSSVLSAVLSIICVYLAKENKAINLGTVKILSQYTVTFLFAAVIYISIIRHGKCLFDKKMWLFALSVSWPLIIHTLSKNILDISDKLMITSICGQSEAGIYGTLYTISMMVLVVWISINSALVPEMFEMLKSGEEEAMKKKIYRLLAFFGWASVLVTMVIPEILKFLTTDEYYAAVKLMPPLIISVFLSSIYNIYGNLLLYKKKTVHIMMATIAAACINVITNYIFIKKHGYFAAAYTTMFSSVALVVFQGIAAGVIYKRNMVSSKAIAGIGLFFSSLCFGGIYLYDTLVIRYMIIVILFFTGGIFILKRMFHRS